MDTPEEAIAAANRTIYGLTSSILVGDTYEAFDIAPKVLAGIVNVNSPTVNDEVHARMGCVRDSGWGRTPRPDLDQLAQRSGPVSLLTATLAIEETKSLYSNFVQHEPKKQTKERTIKCRLI